MKYLGIEGLKYLCNKISTALKNAEGKTGSTASSKKLFLVGAQTQAESSKTYSAGELYCENSALHASEVVVDNTITPGSSTVTIGSPEKKYDSVHAYMFVGDLDGVASNVPWSGVTSKPGTFPPSSHTHDDRYFTESEVNTKLNGYLPRSGGDMNTGASITLHDTDLSATFEVINENDSSRTTMYADGIETTGYLIGNISDSTVTFTTSDTNGAPVEWTDVDLLYESSNVDLASLFGSISTMFRNIRYLENRLNNDNFSRELLWVNSDPSLPFEDEVINVGKIKPGDEFQILFTRDTDQEWSSSITITAGNNGGHTTGTLFVPSSDSGYWANNQDSTRIVRTTTGDTDILDCLQFSFSNDNAGNRLCIPLKIYKLVPSRT